MDPDMYVVEQYIQSNKGMLLQQLVDFVRIPNNVFQPDQIYENAKALRSMMETRGIRVETWETPPGRPLVYGELLTKRSNPTVLLYGHYDGVPVEIENWHSDPYAPVLRASLPDHNDGEHQEYIPFTPNLIFNDCWRIFGRSVADSKNAIVAILAAIDCLHEQNIERNVNLKFLFDGEEEIESPNLPACLEFHRDQLKADFLIAASGEIHQSGLPSIELGVRGILQFNLEVYTAAIDLHSGHFGNFGPSAAFQLAHLLSLMKDVEGRVSIPGFYDEVKPLTDLEQNAIDRIPFIDQKVCQQFGINKPEGNGQSLRQLINQPTLNVRGFHAGFTGDAARNIIPSYAKAEFDVRLVKGMDPDTTLHTIVSYLVHLGWTILRDEPTLEQRLQSRWIARIRKKAGFPATRTPLDSNVVEYVIRAVRRAVGDELVVLPTEGGSLPLYLFEQLGLPVIGLPTSNFDCNQHTHDENLELGYFFRAIRIFASLFM